MEITLQDLEQAINYWRALRPSVGEECALSVEVNVLATLYGLMIFHRANKVAWDRLDPATQQLLESWRKRSV